MKCLIIKDKYKDLLKADGIIKSIENLFAEWEELVRSIKPSTEEELLNAMAEVKNLITSEQCSNYVARTKNDMSVFTKDAIILTIRMVVLR